MDDHGLGCFGLGWRLRINWLYAGISAIALGVAPALAGQVPLNQPAPAWVEKAPLDTQHLAPDMPEVLVLDTQERMEHGELWSYTDRAVRVTSPEALGQLATLILPWAPDKGDLIIHDVAILRDGQTIDLLAMGKGFTVLRREEALEARDLTGILTATMSVEGLRVGDILRLRYSVTLKDAALAGNADVVLPLPAVPLRVGFGRSRVEWEAKAPARWRLLGHDLTAKPFHAGSFVGVEVALPVAKQPDQPGDAPPRFQAPPLLEATTFTSWDNVSRVMAPLYATDGLVYGRRPGVVARRNRFGHSSGRPGGYACFAARLASARRRNWADRCTIAPDGKAAHQARCRYGRKQQCRPAERHHHKSDPAWPLGGRLLRLVRAHGQQAAR